MIQVIKQELKNHKQARLQAKKEKKALKKETKNQEDIAAGMVTPGRVPSEPSPTNLSTGKAKKLPYHLVQSSQTLALRHPHAHCPRQSRIVIM